MHVTLSFSEYLQGKYQNAKILILGFGREGQSTFRALSQCIPVQNIFVMDQNPVLETSAAILVSPQFVPYDLSLVGEYDVLFRTPVISSELPALQAFRKQGGRITSQANELLACFSHQVVGVTGTKGKSTTSSMICHILQSVGKDAVLLGNIGKPAFDYLKDVTPNTLIVSEFSSYQLQDVAYSPHWAVWLNLFPEHLNYHGSFENYFLAKAQITRHQTADDYFFYEQQIPMIQRVLASTVSQLCPFTDLSAASQLEALRITGFEHLPQVVQRHNVLPAVLVTLGMGCTSAQISGALKSFQGLPHRLEKVASFKGITFIDDTLATVPEAAVAALEATPETSVLLVGGYDRGIQFAPIVEAIVERKIPYVVFFPDSGRKMIEILQEKYPKHLHPTYVLVTKMEAAVAQAYEWLREGGTVLLSPASPSFGYFTDYEDKSKQYLAAIKKYSSKNLPSKLLASEPLVSS